MCVTMQGPWDPLAVVNMPTTLASLATPLHIAADNGHAKLVFQLLEVGSRFALHTQVPI